MGDIAEQLIDEEMFGSSERYYIPKGNWKRTPAEKKIASIRKEIAINIKNGMGVQEARKNANLKYGKGWRERLTVKKIYNSPNPFGKMSYF